MQTGPGKSDLVAESLISLPEAHYVAVTTGAYDVFVWAGLESAENLGQFLRTKSALSTGVQRTETFVNLSIKKRTTAWSFRDLCELPSSNTGDGSGWG